MRHDDIDLEQRRIFVREKPDWKPKAGERIIPISEDLALLIAELPKNSSRKVLPIRV